MAEFEIAVEKTLQHEGGFVDRPDDPGGATNYGISQRSYPSLDIRHLSKAEAKTIYKNDYWHHLYDKIEDQRVANSLFDFGVNAGTRKAVNILQWAINDLLAGPLVTDGIFGQNTLDSANACNPDSLLNRYTARRIEYYVSLNKPQFIKGWTSRALDV